MIKMKVSVHHNNVTIYMQTNMFSPLCLFNPLHAHHTT